MQKAKKKIATRRSRGARRFVRLTRAHLEMSGRLTHGEDKRYALTALCVRRVGDAAVVEATNGRMAWQYPAEWVDAGDLPAEFSGRELGDGERALIDPGAAKQCLRALPKAHAHDNWKSAYLAVGSDGIGVLYTHAGASFRLAHYGDDAGWPDFDKMLPERAGPCVTLRVDLLSRLAAWVNKFVLEPDAEERALTLSFFPNADSVGVRFEVPKDGGPVGALGSFRSNDGVMKASMPAWEAVFAIADISGKGPAAEAPTEAAYPGLSATERKLLACLSSYARDIDDITAETELSPAEVSAGLLVLEIRRLARQLPGKKFVKVDRVVRKVVKRKKGR